jgi:7-cyano-7-deazaguanine synthase in queuosine biosynthesis
MGDNVFPDEEPQHLTTLEDEFNRVYLEGEGINERIKIVTPFTGFTKWQIINLGSNLGVDLYDTVSCGDERVAGGFNCGVCPWCEKRRAGFQDSTVPDKTRYLFL